MVKKNANCLDIIRQEIMEQLLTPTTKRYVYFLSYYLHNINRKMFPAIFQHDLESRAGLRHFRNKNWLIENGS